MSQRSLEVYMENLLRRTSLETQSPVQNHMVLIVDDNARTPTEHHTPPSPLLQKALENRSNSFLFDNGEPTLNGKAVPVLPWSYGGSPSSMKDGTPPKGSKWSSSAAKFVCRPLADIRMAPPQRRESSEITCTSVSESCEELWEGDDIEGERAHTTLEHIALAIDIATPDC